MGRGRGGGVGWGGRRGSDGWRCNGLRRRIELRALGGV